MEKGHLAIHPSRVLVELVVDRKDHSLSVRPVQFLKFLNAADRHARALIYVSLLCIGN
jgi:hypothetical protein